MDTIILPLYPIIQTFKSPVPYKVVIMNRHSDVSRLCADVYGNKRDQMEEIRKSLGDIWCHRCDYCQPCPQDIPISLVSVTESIVRCMSYDTATNTKSSSPRMCGHDQNLKGTICMITIHNSSFDPNRRRKRCRFRFRFPSRENSEEVPATNTVAPARTMAGMFSQLTFPSTSSSTSRF
jgi:hypothetical protein